MRQGGGGGGGIGRRSVVNGGRRLIASSCRPTNFSNKRAVDLPPPAARAVALHVIAGKKGNRCVCSSVIYYFEYFT